MTKNEWLEILLYYKKMFQLEHLPAPDYTEAMYEELKETDARFVAYAVRRIVATEKSAYNKYPLLAQINDNFPDFSWERRELEEKGKELKKLLGQRWPKRHVFYEYTQQQIRGLAKFLLGEDKTDIAEAEIDQAVKKKLGIAVDQFFNNTKDQKLIANTTKEIQ